GQLLLDDCPNGVHRRRLPKRRPARQALVERCTQPPHVGPCLLGGLNGAGTVEARQDHQAVLRQPDVGRLHGPLEDPTLVGGFAAPWRTPRWWAGWGARASCPTQRAAPRPGWGRPCNTESREQPST